MQFERIEGAQNPESPQLSDAGHQRLQFTDPMPMDNERPAI